MKKTYSIVIAAIMIILLWHLSSIALNKPFLPSPFKAGLSFLTVVTNGDLTPHFVISSYRVAIGIGCALLLAIPTGLLMGWNNKIDLILSPLLYVLYPIPKVVFLPIILVLFGLGDAPKIILIAFVLYFQLVVVIRDAAKGIPYDQKQVIRSLNATKLQTLSHLTLPYCLPSVMTSLRASLGTALAILFIAETFASFSGLGYYILNRMDSRDYLAMYAGVIGLALLGGGLYALINIAENTACKWYKLMADNSSNH
ncbi:MULTISPECIES: ABC transporter permease [unclassified Lysinibacillus]|uniref:ABC transporter permease n=1 Tax=unclassified Lysinibacillus TaxID=2636778 RepID=UPI00232E959D|nr:ABC transporter permease subunit [Lysinibacillus sp. OF-1]WCH46722.1 ABC transporter permease subunit [Lysinibacillus sp. OF-1]